MRCYVLGGPQLASRKRPRNSTRRWPPWILRLLVRSTLEVELTSAGARSRHGRDSDEHDEAGRLHANHNLLVPGAVQPLLRLRRALRDLLDGVFGVVRGDLPLPRSLRLDATVPLSVATIPVSLPQLQGVASSLYRVYAAAENRERRRACVTAS